MSMLDFHIPLDEIEIRKQRIRNVWDYKKVDHIPVIISIYSNPWNFTIHEQYEDAQKQLAVALEGVKKSLQYVPDDYIPSIRPDVGCVVVSSTFGGELIYNKNMPNTTIGIKPIISDPEEIYKLKIPNPYKDGLMPKALERIRYFAEQIQGKIYISNVDMGGPLNAACDIIESTLFYKMMLKNPEPLKHLLNMLTDLFIYYDQLLIEAAGGLKNMASIDWDNT
ncbi:MAG: uroporphyrinogen decarboxylase family protein, partial [Candidatus Bathyarchaeia archaeon]